MKYVPHDYQTYATKFIEEHPVAAVLLDMGLGKSVIRQRGENGNYIYFKTIKRTVNDIKRVEIEKRLSKDEYLAELMNADTTKRQIRKTRYCLTYENQYFEIDVYPFWQDKAIMEIELSDENEEIKIPIFIRVIKEVTEDDAYKNALLAMI